MWSALRPRRSSGPFSVDRAPGIRRPASPGHREAMLAAPLRPCKADMHVDIVEIPSIPRSVPTGVPGVDRPRRFTRWPRRRPAPATLLGFDGWRSSSERRRHGPRHAGRRPRPHRTAAERRSGRRVGLGAAPGDDRPDGELGPRARGARDGRRGRLRGLGRRRGTTDDRPSPAQRTEGTVPAAPSFASRANQRLPGATPVAHAPGPLRPRVPTGRARGLERRASRSRRHRWTRIRHPRSHRTRGPADRRHRGRTPGGGS